MMAKQVHVSIGILVQRRSGAAWVLIAKRRPDAVLANYWELPGGKIEPGESPQQCLVREYEEELGITVRVDAPLDVIEFAYDHAHVRLHPFYCTLDPNSAPPRNLHVADHRWVEAKDLLQFQFPPANTALIQKVRDTLMVPSRGA
jgi:mutator protein MutT